MKLCHLELNPGGCINDNEVMLPYSDCHAITLSWLFYSIVIVCFSRIASSS